MDSKNVAVIMTSTFVVGFIFGNLAHQKVVTKRIEKAVPLLANAWTNLVNKAIEEDMTDEKLNEIANEELEFIKIALR